MVGIIRLPFYRINTNHFTMFEAKIMVKSFRFRSYGLRVDEFHDGVDFFLCDVFSLLGTLLHCLLVLFGDDDCGGLLRPGAHVDDDQCDDGDGRDDGDSVGLHGTNLQLPSIFFHASRHKLICRRIPG